MQPQVESALIAAFIVVLGWLATHYLTLKKDRILKRQESALRFLERQIEEFYGPLLGLIQEVKIIYEVVKRKVPQKDGRVDQEQFKPEHWEVWRYFVEKHFLRLNREMVNLIRTKMHLMNTIKMPGSFTAFLDHAAQFESLHNLWKDTGISALEVKGKGWPTAFETDVQTTLEELRKLHDNYLQRLSNLPRNRKDN